MSDGSESEGDSSDDDERADTIALTSDWSFPDAAEADKKQDGILSVIYGGMFQRRRWGKKKT